MRRLSRSRTSAAVAATAFLATVTPLVGAASASATPAGGCQSATVQYRLVDAAGKPVGDDWTSQGGFHQWKDAPGTVEVRLAPGQKVGDGCKYPVSLAGYTTEGPSWTTSGYQELVDHAVVYLGADDLAGADDAGRTWQKLSVKSPDCYGQIDLYGDDVVYDGKSGDGHGPAPYQPDNVVTPYHLIAAWNGGDKSCTPDEPSTPTPPASETPPDTPSTPATPPASEPPAEETTPPASQPPSDSTTPPTTPDVPPMQSTPPSPTPSESTPPLAETGSSAPVGLIAGGAALVIALGAGAVFATRRGRHT
ncbi:LAETG motif-containing sortase-dependent surface protein [Streptomyces sp. NPDC047072]|uniref:LAETG motif-containing sortase-dependent surface protein n=1 Tax=Streptomyces sp. NPDC047072 TaxID=3154809 RepID=UPI00340959DE